MSNFAIRARRVKNVLIWVGAIVVGVVLLIGAFTMLNSHGDVDCGGRTMKSGDTCVEVDKHGHRTTRSVDEQASDNTRTGWFMLGGGVLMIIAGGAFLVGEVRRLGGSGGNTGMHVVPNPAGYPGTGTDQPVTPTPPGYPSGPNGGYLPPAYPAAGYASPPPGYPTRQGPSGYAEYPSAAPYLAPGAASPSHPPAPSGYPPSGPR
ncbi:hypothetical protein IRT45_18375 [Nocardia sp. BSTN01]|uniref:hypothetical protein n=1 Tax=Nocardia sp. BSTN01 TaxID=2783665 RepID=UPI00188DCFDE|nr:hypothetical protein [Nocardia sp. BSTN01]MBF4999117.1 hypothetical protein [Nocardia sp. BSTN01]